MARELPYIKPTIWNPVFFSRRGIRIFVGGDGQELIQENGAALRVRLNETLDPGTELEATYGADGFSFHIKSERDAEREAAKEIARERRLADQLAQEERQQLREAEAREFNDALSIPVNWRPAHKIVRSGLLDGSSGTGENRSTVYHVELLEELTDGRLKRKGGDLLCTPDKGSFGISSAREDEAWQVSCKKCLEIAKRFQHEKDNAPKVF